MLDLIIAVVLSLSASAVVAVIVSGLPASARRGAIIGFVAWFAAVVAVAATGVFSPEKVGTIGVGFAVTTPILLAALAWFISPRFRAAAAALPATNIIAVQAVRVLGVVFVILYALGRLPAPFAPSAGWGDIASGLLAIPVALSIVHRTPNSRAAALAWNTFGLLDLVVAVGLGVTSAAGSPIRIFTDGPETAMMSGLPMFIIPGFLVPILISLHLVTFAQLRAASVTSLRPAIAR